MLSGLPLTPDNFAKAKKMLNDQYGNKDTAAKIVRKRIMALRAVTTREQVKNMFFEADALLHHLETLIAKEPDSDEILDHLEESLPPFYFARVLEKKKLVASWNLGEFRKAMHELISDDKEINFTCDVRIKLPKKMNPQNGKAVMPMPL